MSELYFNLRFKFLFVFYVIMYRICNTYHFHSMNRLKSHLKYTSSLLTSRMKRTHMTMKDEIHFSLIDTF